MIIADTPDGPVVVDLATLSTAELARWIADPDARAELQRRLASETGDSVTGEE